MAVSVMELKKEIIQLRLIEQEQAAEIEHIQVVGQLHYDQNLSLRQQVAELTRQRDEAMQDAEKWCHYQKRKQEVIDAGMGRKILRDAAIKESKS